MSQAKIAYLEQLGRSIEQLRSQGKIVEAIGKSIRANAIAAKWLGPSHPMVAGGMSSLALMHFQLGEFDEAITVLKNTLAMLDTRSPGNVPLAGEIQSKIDYVQRFSQMSRIATSNAGAATPAPSSLSKAAAKLDELTEPEHIRAIGNAVRDRYERTNSLEDLNLAIKAAKRTLRQCVPDSADHASDLNNLAGRLLDRFERTSDLDDLDQAIRSLEQGLLLQAAAPIRPILLNNLSTALEYRHRQTRSSTDLQRAIAACQEAAALDPRALRRLFKLLMIFLQEAYRDQHDLEFALHAISQTDFKPELAVALLCNLSLCWVGFYKGFVLRDGHELRKALEVADVAVARSASSRMLAPIPRTLLAMLLLREHERTGASELLARAISLSEEVKSRRIEDGPWNLWLPSIWSELLQRLAQISQQSDNRLVVLDLAIAFGTRAKDAVQDDGKALALSNLSVVLRKRFEAGGDVHDIEAAVDVAEEAFELASSKAPPDVAISNALASALWFRYSVQSRRADLDRGVDVCRLASERQEATTDPIVLNGFAIWLSERFFARGDLSDLDQAIQLWTQAIRMDELGREQRARYSRNVAIAFRERFKRTGDIRDLQRASGSIDGIEKGAHLRAEQKADLLQVRAQLLLDSGPTISLADLFEAVRMLREAESLKPDARSLELIQVSLANALRWIGESIGDINYLDESISIQRKLISGDRPVPDLLTKIRVNLGFSLKARFDVTGGSDDYEAGLKIWEEGIREAMDTLPEVALVGARRWGDWEFERGSWETATRAYEYVRKSVDQVVQTQVTRTGSEAWLRETQGVFARAAFAEAQIQRTRSAVDFLEFGSARLLAEQLQLQGELVERLKADGHNELRDALLESAERVKWLSARVQLDTAVAGHEGPDTFSIEELRHARRTLGEVLERIRKLSCFADYLRPPSLEQLRSFLKNEALVYLAATEMGGLALMIRPGAHEADPEVLWLPELKEGKLREIAKDYWDAYEESRSDPHSRASLAAWASRIEQTTQALWSMVMGGVLDHVAQGTTVRLVPSGVLAMLPLHAAWSPDAAGRRRYAVDSNCFTYLPNARALIASESAHGGDGDYKVLAIADPQPVHEAPLVYSTLEGQTAFLRSTKRRLLQRSDATRKAVMDEIRGFDVVHLACHAHANITQPLKGGFAMAGGDMLTLQDVLDLRLESARLVVLSACETAIPGQKLADEVIGLPTGFLYAGARGVIGSLWSVADMSTTILMARLYWSWRQCGLEPAEALRASQLWVRDAKAADMISFLQMMLSKLELARDTVSTSRRLLQELRKRPSGQRPFSHPIFWAAFTYVGA